MISAYGEKHLMLINKVAVYPNATVQLDSVNRLVLSKVVRRSCRRDSPQQCQHYHSINFMKYFTCKKQTCHWQGIQASTLSVGYGACPRHVQRLWFVAGTHGDVWLKNQVAMKHRWPEKFSRCWHLKLWMKHLKYGGHLGFQDVSNRYRWHDCSRVAVSSYPFFC